MISFSPLFSYLKQHEISLSEFQKITAINADILKKLLDNAPVDLAVLDRICISFSLKITDVCLNIQLTTKDIKPLPDIAKLHAIQKANVIRKNFRKHFLQGPVDLSPLKNILKERGIKYIDLERNGLVHRNTLRQAFTNRKCHYTTIEKLADFLSVPPQSLYTLPEHPEDFVLLEQNDIKKILEEPENDLPEYTAEDPEEFVDINLLRKEYERSISDFSPMLKFMKDNRIAKWKVSLAAGMSKEYLKAYKKGQKVKFDTALKFAEYLNLPVTELYYLSPKDIPVNQTVVNYFNTQHIFRTGIPEDIKKMIADEYKPGKTGYRAIATKYNLDVAHVYRIVKKYKR